MKGRVLVFGTFDLLHPGHVAMLRAAKRYGDELVVVVARDSDVNSRKGTPLFNERERLVMVRSIRYVNRAMLGDVSGRVTKIRRLAPDVICIGPDQDSKHPSLLLQLPHLKKIPRIIKIAGYKRARYQSSFLRKN